MRRWVSTRSTIRRRRWRPTPTGARSLHLCSRRWKWPASGSTRSTTTGRTAAQRARPGATSIAAPLCAPDMRGREHDVHHKIPFRTFGYVPGLNERYLEANRLDNLMLVCRACHRRLETAGRLHTGWTAFGYVLSSLAPLHPCAIARPGRIGGGA